MTATDMKTWTGNPTAIIGSAALPPPKDGVASRDGRGAPVQSTRPLIIGRSYGPTVVKKASVRFAVLPVLAWMKKGRKSLPRLVSPS